MPSWTEALKKWNKDKPKWSIPKKGTAGYDEVKKMMSYDTPKVETKPKPKAKVKVTKK